MVWATMWLLGFEFRNSGRAVGALNHWAISPVPESCLYVSLPDMYTYSWPSIPEASKISVLAKISQLNNWILYKWDEVFVRVRADLTSYAGTTMKANILPLIKINIVYFQDIYVHVCTCSRRCGSWLPWWFSTLFFWGLLYFVLFCFALFCWDMVSLCVAWLAWNSLCRPGWPHTQRSTCLPSAGINCLCTLFLWDTVSGAQRSS